MFSSRASRPLSSRWINGAGSLKKGESAVANAPASVEFEEGTSSDRSEPTQAEMTAVAPPTIIRRKNWRRSIPRALTHCQSDAVSPYGGADPVSASFMSLFPCVAARRRAHIILIVFVTSFDKSRRHDSSFNVAIRVFLVQYFSRRPSQTLQEYPSRRECLVLQ